MSLDSSLLFAVLGIIFFWLIIITFFIYRILSRYIFSESFKEKRDINSSLEKTELLVKKFGVLEKETLLHTQKVGLVRFNPFSETGGDQSFTLALLDGNDTGVIVSSLHSRDNTRLYAKPVEKGKPKGYDFSKEEQEAISRACKKN